jgi:hypothetical protein
LVLILGVLSAAGVFRVKTPEGTIVLQNLPPDAEVTVDGGKVMLTTIDGKTVAISIAAGKKQRLEVVKEGFKTFGEEVEIDAGGSRSITVRLEPLARVEPPAPQQAQAPPAGAFVPLFNGKDLTGWKTLNANKAAWEVKDGVLQGNGGVGYLFTDDRYGNFHLRVEAMINDGGNSGVFFRAPFGQTTPQGHPAYGYEAQINITHSDPNKTGSLYHNHSVVVGVPKTPTELDRWFTLEVRADGPHVVVKVNGRVTADFVDLTPSRSGRIALQVLDAKTVAQFRKVEIKELPRGDLRLQYPHPEGVFEQVKGKVWLERRGKWLGYFREHNREGGLVALNRKIEKDKTGVMHITKGNGAWWNVQGTTRWTRVISGHWAVLPRTPPPPRSANVRLGEWVPLLNGTDLKGWEPAGSPRATWAYEGGALVGRSEGEVAGLLLTERADYENFHLRMEARLSEGTYSALFLRCGPANEAGAAGNKCYAVRIGTSGGGPATGNLGLSAHFDDVAHLGLAAATRVDLGPEQWFPLEVLAVGNRLRVLVDGKTVVDYTDTNATFTVGRLGLVCRGNAVVRFRKLEIKELPEGSGR